MPRGRRDCATGVHGDGGALVREGPGRRRIVLKTDGCCNVAGPVVEATALLHVGKYDSIRGRRGRSQLYMIESAVILKEHKLHFPQSWRVEGHIRVGACIWWDEASWQSLAGGCATRIPGRPAYPPKPICICVRGFTTAVSDNVIPDIFGLVLRGVEPCRHCSGAVPRAYGTHAKDIENFAERARRRAYGKRKGVCAVAAVVTYPEGH
ncbi:hypothetical protein EI94DRAFT_1699023 [Lactarius quietus]|nr:hypothetical protein EI94DRAFT_1699023 [Lactarius quietus]